MKIAGREALGLAAVLLVALLLAACGGGDGDDTGREITEEELSLMLLSQADLGSAYADFELDEDDSGYQSNEDAAADDLDPEDEARDIEEFGRVSGYGARYSAFGALVEGTGPVVVSFGVQLFEDADGASDYAADSIDDLEQQVGEEAEGVVLEEVTTFEVEEFGDETVALLRKGVLEDEEGNRLELYATFVGFREGRILGGVTLGRLDDEDVSSEAAALAGKLHERVLAVLEGEVTPAPATTPGATAAPAEPSAAIAPTEFVDSFHFTSSVSMTVNGGITLDIEGDYQAPDRIACTIGGGIGDVTFAEDKLIVIGDDAWLDTGSGWERTTASDIDVQTDLDLCPGWAGYWTDLDFVEDLGQQGGGEQETVNDVPAIRYDVGTAFQELAGLGFVPAELEGVEIEVYDVWLAEDGRWPVALEMIASAEAEALAEAMGLPPGEAGEGQASLEMRIDISQVDSPSISVEPPTS